MEDAQWGNGAFTKALVEGLKGAADIKNQGKITVSLLDFYVADCNCMYGEADWVSTARGTDPYTRFSTRILICNPL